MRKHVDTLSSDQVVGSKAFGSGVPNFGVHGATGGLEAAHASGDVSSAVIACTFLGG